VIAGLPARPGIAFPGTTGGTVPAPAALPDIFRDAGKAPACPAVPAPGWKPADPNPAPATTCPAGVRPGSSGEHPASEMQNITAVPTPRPRPIHLHFANPVSIVSPAPSRASSESLPARRSQLRHCEWPPNTSPGPGCSGQRWAMKCAEVPFLPATQRTIICARWCAMRRGTSALCRRAARTNTGYRYTLSRSSRYPRVQRGRARS
jgi:hypothetical protein